MCRGAIFTLKCPKCKYKSEWELWYAHGYRKEHDTMDEISKGLWGKKLQSFSQNNEVIIDTDEVMFVCDACRMIDVRPSLAYKKQFRKMNSHKFQEDANHFGEMLKKHMKKDYTDWVRYQHLCKKCNTQMRKIINPEGEGPILCSECGEILIVSFSNIRE